MTAHCTFTEELRSCVALSSATHDGGGEGSEGRGAWAGASQEKGHEKGRKNPVDFSESTLPLAAVAVEPQMRSHSNATR